ncbi:MAG: molybdopterin-dependent oxidoreductase, partial [Rhodovibrionaceae bacterium]
MPGDKEVLRTTCPRDCYDSCGIAVIKRGGAVRKVLGDPEHPVSRGALCGKCALAYNGAWRDPEARLLHPLRRSGAKGHGRFEEVSWETALREIAEKLQAILAEHPAESVIHTHYTGTCSAIAGGFPCRFFNRIGATEVDPDTVCNKAGHLALDYTLGTSSTGFDPRSARDADCLLIWGANPHASAPHAHKHWIPEFQQRGKVIVIDPVAHPTALAADLHLRPRPGSDAALAFALTHAALQQGHLDRDFLAHSVLGWEEVLPAVEAATPAWGETETGVPAAKIEAAAALYGPGPSLLWLGQGLQRQPQGGNVFRAATMLAAATGNFGRPGAGLLFLNGGGSRKLDFGLAEGDGAPGASISHMDLAAALEDPVRSQAFFNWNNNPAASGPEQARLRRALAREDLLGVCVDLFQSDTADYADYVLPAASFLEFDDLVSGYFNLSLSAQTQVMQPLGEALPNQEIFRRLARAMGFEDPELFEQDETLIARILTGSRYGGDFTALKQAGTVPLFEEPHVPFADGVYPTPSGRIELASAAAEADGHPRCPQPTSDPEAQGGRLRVLSPASAWLMNSSYGNDATIREKMGPATAILHPEEAAARGLRDGQAVVLENETGSLPLVVSVSEEAPPG